MADAGKYNKDSELYQKLLDEMYEKYGEGVRLGAEYASFVDSNLLMLLIRLARYKFIAKEIKKSDTVLEIGCGSGLGALFLSQHAKSVKGIDAKSSEIDEARSINRRENLTFECCDFFEKRFEDGFDVVVNLDVIEHLGDEDANRMLHKISKTLTKNGFAVIGTPSLYSWQHQGALSKASHTKCYDAPELLSLIERHFGRTLLFSMNDEIVHTGYYKMAWYYFVLAFYPKECRC